MGMYPQTDPITGSIVLRIPAIRSPNYVAGTSGWSINIDGSAEFNSVVVRGSLVTGTAGGARVEIGTTPGEIDFYDSLNHLVLKMGGPTQPGGIYSESPTTHNTVFINSGSVFLYNSTLTDTPASVSFTAGAAGDDQLQVFSGFEAGGSGTSLILHADPSNLGAGHVESNQRGVSGSLVQADTTSTNNLTHSAKYTLLTDASGQWNQAHNCGFTPTGCQITQQCVAASGSCTFVVFDANFTSSNFKGMVKLNGALLTNNNVGVYVTFFG